MAKNPFLQDKGMMDKITADHGKKLPGKTSAKKSLPGKKKPFIPFGKKVKK